MYDFMERCTVKSLQKRGFSYSRIARELGCDRRTVKRLLEEPVGKKYSRPVSWSPVDDYRDDIREWLKAGVPVKRMFEMAREDPDRPFTGSKTAFYRRVGKFREEMKKDEPDAWLRFEGLPGEYVQIDWGEIRNFPFLLQEKTTRYFFCARLKYSRFSYVEFAKNMKRETLMRCMLRAFESFGGVPWICVFDNMKTVSPGREKGGKPIWCETFEKFAGEIDFHPDLCHPYSGNQKGSVENLVGWVKSSFIPGREFLNDDDLNTQCREWLEKKNNSVSQAHGQVPSELLKVEVEKFTPLTESASTYGIYGKVSVGPESLVNLEGSRYSVPVGCVGRVLTARIRENSIDFYYEDRLVASHKRMSGKKKPVIIPDHFEEVLKRKPRGRVMIYREHLMSADESVKAYIAEVCRRNKGTFGPQILDMFELFREYGIDNLGCACALASEHGAYGADYLTSLLRKPEKTEVIGPLDIEGVPVQDEIDRSLSFYENFVVGGEA